MTDRRFEFVKERHAGQVDKLGKDYFDSHLSPVAESVPEDLFYVGLAHDVLEDTDATKGDLYEAGFDTYEVMLIDALTKRPNEPLDRYIGRVRIWRDARVVKIADVVSNLTRLHYLDVGTQVRLKQKYQRTLTLLVGG